MAAAAFVGGRISGTNRAATWLLILAGVAFVAAIGLGWAAKRMVR